MNAIKQAVILPNTSRNKFSKIITKLDEYILDSSYPTIEKAKMQSNGSIYWKFDINKFYTFYSKNIKTEITPEIIDTILQNFSSFPLYLSDSFIESLEFNKQTAKLIFNDTELMNVSNIESMVKNIQYIEQICNESAQFLNLQEPNIVELQNRLRQLFNEIDTNQVRLTKFVNTKDKLKSIKKNFIQEAILTLEELDEIETLYFNIETLESGIGQMIQDIYFLGYFLQPATATTTIYENLREKYFKSSWNRTLGTIRHGQL